MAAAHRKFTADPPPQLDEYVSFEMTGTWGPQARKAGQEWSETFRVVPDYPIGVMEDLLLIRMVDDDGYRQYRQSSMLRVFRSVLSGDDHRRFQALVRDPDRLVTMQFMASVTEWLVEVMLERPTGPRPASTGGTAASQGDGNGSTADSAPPVSTPTL